MRLNRISKWLLPLLLLSTTAEAQVTIPNTFSPNTTAQSALVNANFSQLGQQALNRAGGIITGNISVDPGVTIDGIDIGAVLGGTGTPTFTSITVTSQVAITGTGAAALLVSGGITAGSGNVAIVNTTGKIPALTSTYFASLDGSTITGIAEANITDGSLLARVGANETITGAWTFSANAPAITLNNGTSNYILWGNAGAGAPTFTTHSVGSKLIIHNDVNASQADFALGIESGAMWLGVATTANNFKWYGGTTNVATLTGTGSLSVTGSLAVAGRIAPTTLGNGDNNDYAPAGFADSNLVVATGGTSSKITGIAGGTAGRQLTLCYATTSFTIEGGNAGSSAANRFASEVPVTTIGPTGASGIPCVQILYDATTARWRVVGKMT